MNCFSKIKTTCQLALLFLCCVACQSNHEAAEAYFNEGMTYYNAAEYNKARVLFLNAMQKNPRYAPAYYYLGLLAERDNDLPLMFERLVIASSLDPKNLDAKAKVARLLVLSQRFDEAIVLADEIEKLAPASYEALLIRAAALIGKKDFVAAEPVLESAALQNADDEHLLAMQSALEKHKGNLDQALLLLDRALHSTQDKTQYLLMKLSIYQESSNLSGLETTWLQLAEHNPKDSHYLLLLVDLYLNSERAAEAEKLLSTYIQNNPADLVLKETLIDVQSAIDPQRAYQTLQQMIASTPNNFSLRMLRADLYIKDGKIDEADSELQSIAQSSIYSEGEKIDADALRAKLLFRQKRPQEAMILVMQGLAKQADHEDLLLLRAEYELGQHNYGIAASDIRNILRKNPNSEPALLLMGRIHLASGSVFLADNAFRKVLDFNPSNLEATYNVANSLLVNNDFIRAEGVVKDALVEQPNNKNLLRFLVQIKLQKEEVNQAEGILASIADPEEEQTALLWARVHQIKNNHDQALTALHALVERNPDSLAALQGLAVSYLAQNRREELLNYLQSYTQQHPRSQFGYSMLALVEREGGNFDNAERHLQTALQINPAWPEGYISLGQLYREQNNRPKAIQAYQTGISASPENAQLRLVFAAFYEQEDMFSEAEKVYLDLLAKQPDNIIAANNYANLLLDKFGNKENYAKALALSKVFAQESSGYYLDTWGWALVKNERFQEAESILRNAAKAAPGVATIHYHLGIALQGQGRVEEAKNSFKTAQRYVEADSELVQVLEKLLAK